MNEALEFLIKRGYSEDVTGEQHSKGTEFFWKNVRGLSDFNTEGSPLLCVYVHVANHGLPVTCVVELDGSHRPGRRIQMKVFGGLTIEALKEDIETIENELTAVWLHLCEIRAVAAEREACARVNTTSLLSLGPVERAKESI